MEESELEVEEPKVKEPLIETLDLPVELTMELIPSLTAMRALLS